MSIDEDRWKNRRRMAWLCVWASLGYPMLLIAQADSNALIGIAGPFYLFTGAVVGAYIGFATWDDKPTTTITNAGGPTVTTTTTTGKAQDAGQ